MFPSLRTIIIFYIVFTYCFAIKLNRDTGGWDRSAWVVFIGAPGAVSYILVAAVIDYLNKRLNAFLK